MDSPKSSEFKVVVKRRYYASGYVQILGLAPSSKGAPTANSVIGPDDDDGSEYIPR